MAKEMVEKIDKAGNAMKYFRIYIQALGTRNMERVMVAKAKYEIKLMDYTSCLVDVNF